MMKNKTALTAFLFSLLIMLSGCEVIGGIFKAGVGVGIFVVVIVIALIIFILMKLGGKKGN